MNVIDVEQIMEQWAPHWTAWEKDNVGLQIGDRTRRVRRVLVSLDVTPEVVNEAVRRRAEMIVAHHPILFRPLSSIISSDVTGSMILELAKNDIAVYAAHTNLDAARGGVSFALAEALKLANVHFLAPLPDLYAKIAVFVPSAHVSAVMNAMAQAGAGQIGDYSRCSFQINGRGTFQGANTTDPYVGTPGVLEETDEVRLEMILPRFHTPSVIEAMQEAHPYEEVAYDLYPLSNDSPQYGMGAIGELASPLTLESFLKTVKKTLGCEGLRYAGNPRKIVRTVAVCGGSGSQLIQHARDARADVFVTADIKYHAFQEAGGQIALIDAGHWETEQVVLPAIAERLRKHAPKGKEGISVLITNQRTNSIHYH